MLTSIVSVSISFSPWIVDWADDATKTDRIRIVKYLSRISFLRAQFGIIR